jgi:hypothetical protein
MPFLNAASVTWARVNSTPGRKVMRITRAVRSSKLGATFVGGIVANEATNAS